MFVKKGKNLLLASQVHNNQYVLCMCVCLYLWRLHEMAWIREQVITSNGFFDTKGKSASHSSPQKVSMWEMLLADTLHACFLLQKNLIQQTKSV